MTGEAKRTHPAQSAAAPHEAASAAPAHEAAPAAPAQPDATVSAAASALSDAPVPSLAPAAPAHAAAPAAPVPSPAAPHNQAPYLKRIKIVSFGAFSGEVVGPFSPHLNVVFGKNEAGKTTLASFVGGVLFGWEDARGVRNTYKPENAERSGSLFFARSRTREDDADEAELARTRNADGLTGDDSLLADIDKETFKTMFSLTSDELRSLRNTTDVTAKLLTAGSGTSASPAHALAAVQERLAEYTSRAAGVEHSIVNLTAQQNDVRERMARAAEEAERFKQQDKEFHELEPQRKELNARLADLNSRIDALGTYRTRLQKLEEERDQLMDERDRLREEERALKSARHAGMQDVSTALMSLSAAEDRALRDRIDAYAEEQAKVAHRVDVAKENHATSRAAYEALQESGDHRQAEARARRQRHVQVALSVVLPLGFVCAGVPVLIHGRHIASLSFTALGIGLVVFALLLAGAALVMLFRPNKEEEERAERLQNAQWVMLQDRKKLEVCQSEQRELDAKIASYLREAGLAEAGGSLRRARVLLEEAKDARAEAMLRLQRQDACAAHQATVEGKLADVARQQERIYARMDLGPHATLVSVDAEIARRTQQRESLLETFGRTNRRYGELEQELAQAKHLKDFDALKLRYQQVRTRQDESAHDYARLLLAKRMLESAIAAWESKSQPEVYRKASELLKTMTGGRWTKVAMTPEGRLQVTDAVRNVREPVHLSLGTCQQLYLSLRIALLLTADNVGRAIPILADDILVNFDAERRRGAARALAELAASRQVILFTCHEEVVEALREAAPDLNEVAL